VEPGVGPEGNPVFPQTADRHDEILFIDARKMGKMVTRKNRELTNEDVSKISDTYHAWRNPSTSSGQGKNGKYEDIKGFCKAANLKEIEKHGFVLTPGRYVGFEIEEEDDEVFEEKMKRLTKELNEQFGQSSALEDKIKKN